jgi:hypothetical protein
VLVFYGRHRKSSKRSSSDNAVEMMRDATGRRGIARFNDAPTTTYEMVLAAFRAAIEKARQAELDMV